MSPCTQKHTETVSLSLYMYISLSLCIYMYIYIHTLIITRHAYIYICICMYVCEFVHVVIREYVCVCTYITYTYLYTHLHLYKRIRIPRTSDAQVRRPAHIATSWPWCLLPGRQEFSLVFERGENLKTMMIGSVGRTIRGLRWLQNGVPLYWFRLYYGSLCKFLRFGNSNVGQQCRPTTIHLP